MSAARLYRATGHVQGVGFRAFVVRAAKELGLHGAVRNDTDGAVTAVAEGSAADLAQLARRLARGPAFARVDRVTETEIDGLPEREPFDVRF